MSFSSPIYKFEQKNFEVGIREKLNRRVATCRDMQKNFRLPTNYATLISTFSLVTFQIPTAEVTSSLHSIPLSDLHSIVCPATLIPLPSAVRIIKSYCTSSNAVTTICDRWLFAFGQGCEGFDCKICFMKKKKNCWN